jgi:hypothetical protein
MDKKYLIKIAHDAILEELQGSVMINKAELYKQYPQLKKRGAAFVTLELDKNLRGCIGSLIAHRTLLDDIVANAKAAAFKDTRFRPLSQKEFDYRGFSIEVSLLSEPKALNYKDANDLYAKVRPGIDGVVLRKGNYQATYLPQVWEQLNRPDKFFASLCQKAGMRTNCLDFHPEIFIYQVEKIT